MDLRDIGWGSVEWFQLALDGDWWRALVNTAMNLRVLAPRSLPVCRNTTVVLGGYTMVSHLDDLGSVLGEFKKDSCWTKWPFPR
jgi:hypothetical protein